MVLHGLLNKNNEGWHRASEASNSSSVLYTKESPFPTFAQKAERSHTMKKVQQSNKLPRSDQSSIIQCQKMRGCIECAVQSKLEHKEYKEKHRIRVKEITEQEVSFY